METLSKEIEESSKWNDVLYNVNLLINDIVFIKKVLGVNEQRDQRKLIQDQKHLLVQEMVSKVKLNKFEEEKIVIEKPLYEEYKRVNKKIQPKHPKKQSPPVIKITQSRLEELLADTPEQYRQAIRDKWKGRTEKLNNMENNLSPMIVNERGELVISSGIYKIGLRFQSIHRQGTMVVVGLFDNYCTALYSIEDFSRLESWKYTVLDVLFQNGTLYTI